MSSFLISRQFYDFDVFATATKHWRLDFMPLERGKFQGKLLQFGDEDVQIGDCLLGMAMHQRGEARPDCYTLAIPHSQCTPFTWRQANCPVNGIAIFPEDNELDAVSSSGFHVLTVTVSERYLNKYCEKVRFPEPEQFMYRGRISLLDISMVNQIRVVIESACNTLQAYPSILNQQSFLASFKENLISSILQALLGGMTHLIVEDRSRRKLAVRRAVEYIHDNPEEPSSISQLCEVAGVSERTLRYGFQDLFSVPPKQYLLYRKLHQVRRKLMSEVGSRQQIADIANSNGFWHMGQFAADYRKLFGELPSQTRRKKHH